MTREKMMNMIKDLKNDATYFEYKGIIHVDLDDFEGFDENWDEQFREYDDADAVENFLDTLEKEALEIDEDYYTTYKFDGFAVKLGYTSYDI